LKRKRQQPQDDAMAVSKKVAGKGGEATKQGQAISTLEPVNPVLGLIANYASSSDDDEE
jgi:hypothetical protein